MNEPSPEAIADMEKIAREAAHNIDARLPYGFTNDETDIVEDEICNAFAQACAPLVELLHDLRPHVIPSGQLRQRIDAALTDTGEEEALAGRTGDTTNKKESNDDAR